MTLQPGTKIGTYEVLEKIGAGGMGAVYKGYQTALGRYVAIKVLPPQTAGDPAFAERFAQEARAIGKLRHPNIVTAFDFAHEGDVAFLVSEFVDGGTLAEQLGAPLPLDYALQVLTPIAAALDYAHARGVVHRDIKPQNVLMTHEGVPVLTDFGLAKIVGPGSGMTQAGSLMGTAEYIAPECASGAEVAGPPADQYALALIAYQMLVGRHPFPSDNPLSALMAHVHTPVPLPSALGVALPPGTEAALLRGLSKRPQDRFPRAGDMVRALAGSMMTAAAPGLVAAPTPSPTPTTSPAIASVSALVRPPEPAPPTVVASAEPVIGAATPALGPTTLAAGGAGVATIAPRPLAAEIPPWWRRKRMLILPILLVALVIVGALREQGLLRVLRANTLGTNTPQRTAPASTAPAVVVPTATSRPTVAATTAPAATATVAPTVAPTPFITLPPPATLAPTPTPAGDDHGNTPLTSTLIKSGAHGGAIETAGDIDWFRFSVDAPSQIIIDFVGKTLKGGMVALYAGAEASGQLTPISEETDTGSGARITYSGKAGTYLIRVRGTRDQTGTYGFGLVVR